MQISRERNRFFLFRDVRCQMKPHICYGMAVLVACITVAIQPLIWNMPFEIKSITIWMRAMKSKKNTCLWPFIYFWNDLVVGTFAGWISPINRWQLIKTSDIQIISNILLFAIRPDFRFHGKQTDWDGDQTNFIRWNGTGANIYGAGMNRLKYQNDSIDTGRIMWNVNDGATTCMRCKRSSQCLPSSHSTNLQ